MIPRSELRAELLGLKDSFLTTPPSPPLLRSEVRTRGRETLEELRSFSRIYEEVRNTGNLERLIEFERSLLRHPLCFLSSFSPEGFKGIEPESILYWRDSGKQLGRSAPLLWKYVGKTKGEKIELLPLNHNPDIRRNFEKVEVSAEKPPFHLLSLRPLREEEIPSEAQGQRMRFLSEEEAHALAEKINRLLGGKELTSEGSYEVGGKSYAVESDQSYDREDPDAVSRLVRIGPLIFVVMPRLLTELPELIGPWLRRLKNYLGELYPSYSGNIFFITPSLYMNPKFTRSEPLSLYTQGPIAAMLAHFESFREATLVEFGGGDALLGRIGGWGFGTPRKVIMIEKSHHTLRVAKAHIQAQVDSGRRTRDELILLEKDFTQPDFAEVVKEHRLDSAPTVAIINIGPWSFYRGADRKALGLALSWSGLRLAILGGYRLSDAEQREDYGQLKERLREEGFKLKEIFKVVKRQKYKMGVLIATPARAESLRRAEVRSASPEASQERQASPKLEGRRRAEVRPPQYVGGRGGQPAKAVWRAEARAGESEKPDAGRGKKGRGGSKIENVGTSQPDFPKRKVRDPSEELDKLAEAIIPFLLQRKEPPRAEVRRLHRILTRGKVETNWPVVERVFRKVTERILSPPQSLADRPPEENPELFLGRGALSLARNPVQLFELLHQTHGRNEKLPQGDLPLSFAIHAPLLPKHPEEEKKIVEKTLASGGYLVVPFEREFEGSLSSQKLRKDRLARKIYASRDPAMKSRFRPLEFLEALDYERLLSKLDPPSPGPLLTLMADESLRIPKEKRAQTLAFLIEPELLSVLKLSEILSLLQVIGSARSELREFYLQELGLVPNPQTGLAPMGSAFLERLARLSRAKEVVNAAA